METIQLLQKKLCMTMNNKNLHYSYSVHPAVKFISFLANKTADIINETHDICRTGDCRLFLHSCIEFSLQSFFNHQRQTHLLFLQCLWLSIVRRPLRKTSVALIKKIYAKDSEEKNPSKGEKMKDCWVEGSLDE